MSGISKTGANKKQNNYIKLIFCGLAGSGIYFLLLSLLTFVTLKINISESLFMPAGIFIAFVSGFFSGYTAVRPFMQKGLVFGSLSGLVCLFVCAVLLFAINGGKAGSRLIITSLIILSAAAFGGIVAVGSKPKRKR